jgi:hypothetical protein
VVLRYLMRTTGYSRQQLTRLVAKWSAKGCLVKAYGAPSKGFARRFTEADVALLAETDALHNTLSGPATRHLMRGRWNAMAMPATQRWRRSRWASLQPAQEAHWLPRRVGRSSPRPGRPGIAIGERRAPAPDNRPGFIRIDSVHQGDQDGIKGVYHINAVDCVTQWELVATCEKISEAYLLPVIEALLDGFPFPHPRLPCRQRLGVHQPQSGQDARQAVRGIHQVAPAPFQRQRSGGNQERRRYPQASGLQPHSTTLSPPR